MQSGYKLAKAHDMGKDSEPLDMISLQRHVTA